MRELKTRNEELKKVVRYGTKGEWAPMFYRPDLLIHTARVAWITEEISKYLKSINPSIFSKEKAIEFAKFHDDSEILAGDIISLKKENFTPEEKQSYAKKTLEAIDILSQHYASETHLDYKELLLLDFNKTGTEYLIGMYADKLDAHMEVCHELFAGNIIFSQELKKWNVAQNCFEYTKKRVLGYLEELESIFGVPLRDTIPFFRFPDIDLPSIVAAGKPHSEDSLQKTTGYTPYDSWRELHFLYGNSREKEYLWNQKEFT